MRLERMITCIRVRQVIGYSTTEYRCVGEGERECVRDQAGSASSALPPYSAHLHCATAPIQCHVSTCHTMQRSVYSMAYDEDNMSDDHNRGTCLLRQCNEKAIPGLMLLTRVLGSDVTQWSYAHLHRGSDRRRCRHL